MSLLLNHTITGITPVTQITGATIQPPYSGPAGGRCCSLRLTPGASWYEVRCRARRGENGGWLASPPLALSRVAGRGHQAPVRPKIPELVEALNGTFRVHHAFMVRVHRDRIDQRNADIAAILNWPQSFGYEVSLTPVVA